MTSPIKTQQIEEGFELLTVQDLQELKLLVESHEEHPLIEWTWEKAMMVDFNWPRWEEGSKFHEEDRWDFTDKDLNFCYHLLKAIIRANRFTDYLLESILKSGKLVGLADRLIELKNHDHN